MHKIIQTYNTFEGERLNAGFSTIRSMKQYLQKSYSVHSKIADYKMYTDVAGYEVIKDIIDKNNVEIINFPIIDDRLIYIGKFQVQEFQKEPYIHIDIDATLYEMPKTDADIITEKLRSCSFNKEVMQLGISIDNIGNIICSGLLGFNDITFKDIYINEVFEKIKLLKSIHDITFALCYTLEEVLLKRLCIDHNKTIYELQNYNHLQGRFK
ncbi:MAG: hypothetical protein WC979_00830 [Candidatus Pacearchaeota archaeon]|jgi:hypothetical protein|nr:hypothetical protein [Clostridia bacterium]